MLVSTTGMRAHSMMNISWLGIVAAPILIGLPVHAAAQTMSLAELRGCAVLAAQRGTASPAADLAATHARLLRDTAAIDAERATIDRRDPRQVAMFNDRVVRVCDEYAAYVAAFNAVIALQNTRTAAFNATCSDRDFDPGLAATLPDELKVAWLAAAGSEPALPSASLPPMPHPLAP